MKYIKALATIIPTYFLSYLMVVWKLADTRSDEQIRKIAERG